jgi:NADH-quinone oxidoreductase subunit G
MAAATQVQTVNIVVNGIDLVVPKGELVVEAVKRLGLEIPIFCYHPRMKPVGMCRMCLVETGMKNPQDGTIRMMPKPAAACTLPVSEGLVINTDSEALRRDRKGVLEFLLVNHPLDCPICDRGGECPLQNNTLFYGPSTSRFIEMKRHAQKAFPLSEYVTLDLERCIQCARCVRFTEEISGDSQLAFRFRGAKTQPITFDETKFTSKFSGNVIEICPVGALTNRKYRFRARPWDLQTSPAICTQCSNGCNIWFDHRGGKMVRINGRTHEGINEEWTCDKGKFGHDFYNDDKRLATPFLRKNNELAKGNWADAFEMLLTQFNGRGSEAGLLIGHQVSNESAFSAINFFRNHVESDHIDHRFEEVAYSETPTSQDSIESIESAKSILVFGTSLADDLPIVYLRVRKAWFQNAAKVVVAYDRETDVDSFASHILRYKTGTAETLASALSGKTDLKTAAEVCDIPLFELESAKLLMERCLVITSTNLYSEDLVGALQDLRTLGSFNCFARGANERGLQLLGATPKSSGYSTYKMLSAAAQGEIKALWLLDVDLFNIGLEDSTVEKILENVEFLVVQTSARNETFLYSSVALPLALPAETEGTFTSCENRIQRLGAAIPPVGESKPGWRVFEDLSVRIQPRMPAIQPKDVFSNIEIFNGLSYADLGTEGKRV